MSEGVFSRTIYEADSGDFHPIRVQPETLTLTFGSTANAAGAGPIDNPISAKVSNGNRSFGVKPRSVTLVFETTAPTGYKVNSPFRLPILTPALYSTIALYDTATYQGQTAKVVGKSPERVR